MKLQEIPFAEVQRIYADIANVAFPLSEKEYADIISAEYMVFGRKGLGGPQVVETERVLITKSEEIQADNTWQQNQNNGHLQSLIIANELFAALRI